MSSEGESRVAPDSKGIHLFQRGQYHEALKAFSNCLLGLPLTASGNAFKIHVLFNRSACYLKLKHFEKVVEDCDGNSTNSKALGRKIKALCSLRDFQQAQQTTLDWIVLDPHNPLAQREHERLDIIVKALDDQDCDDETLDMMPGSGERVPPDGQEDAKSSNSPSTTVPPTSLPITSSSITVVASSNNLPDLNELSRLSSKPSNKMIQLNIAFEDAKAAVKLTPIPPAEPQVEKPRVSYSSKVKGCTEQRKPSLSEKSSPVPAKPTIKDEETQENQESTLKKWKYRAPPRGLTAQEYSLCPQSVTCRFGDQCTQAHSDEELGEWKLRFDERQKRMSSGESTYADKLMEKWMNTKTPETVMVEEIEGVNVHCSSDLTMVTLNKQCGHVWLFTVTCKECLHTVALLDDANREHFHISMISVGPKRQQKTHRMDERCQEWLNTLFTPGKASIEKVYRVRVQFSTTIYGTFRQSLVFDFGDEPVLVQPLCVESGPVTDLTKLEMDLKMSEQGRWDLSSMDAVSFSPKPQANDTEEETLLLRYPAPMATNFTASPVILQPELTPVNYRTRMHHLLCIEEMAQFSNVAKFNLKSSLQLVDRFLLMPSAASTAKFAQNGELFAKLRLNAELSEDTAHGRLILQNCNTVYLAPYDSSKPDHVPSRVFEALVEEKGKNFIMLHLSKDCVEGLRLEKDSNFSAQVQFQLNRLPLCEMHLAIDLIPDLSLLFPSTDLSSSVPWNPLKQWSHDLDSRLNPRQKEAVVAITTDLDIKLLPILLMGPYGTGKTFTLAQATLEILRDPATRVLICTHSNSAADLYISDYLHASVESGNIDATPLRVYYRYRWVQTVHQIVRKYCLIDNQNMAFRVPTKEDIEKHRVVVTSLGTSRYLHNLNLPIGFFTHILLDEAAQAMECETILPLALAGPKTRVVLAGDHMQLSPEVHSEFARDRNLHVSLLERIYDLYPSGNQCQILLCENYRSHKAIIDFTSELFYNNKLVASGNQPRHPQLYPLTFFTARGEDVQHQNSTGFYNNSEVYEIVERIAELQKAWPASWGPLNEGSIGVVSPYSDQVMRIRYELRKKKMYKVSVERVLNVQGKQFRAIFLSTVRTSNTCRASAALEDYIEYGFLSNAKLLNTAITRAQSLVAVAGDPVSLCSIGKCRKLWERFLELCHQNHSLHGITWANLRAHLDGVELKKTYVLNPLAPEFVPNRLRHACYKPPEPIAVGKYGYTFTPPQNAAPPVVPVVKPAQAWPPVQYAPYYGNPYMYQLMTLPYSNPYTALSRVLVNSPNDAARKTAAFQGFPLTQQRHVRPPVGGQPKQPQFMPFFPPHFNHSIRHPPEPQRPSNIQFLPTACNISKDDKTQQKVLDSPLLQAELLGYMHQTEGKQVAASYLQGLSKEETDKQRKEAKGTFFCSDLEQVIDQPKDPISEQAVQNMISFLEDDPKPPRPSSLPWNSAERDARPLYLRGAQRKDSSPLDSTPPLATPITPYCYPAKTDNPFFPRPDSPNCDKQALELLKNLEIKSPPDSLHQYFA